MSWPSKFCAGWLEYWDEIFCCIYMENCLGKRDKYEIKLENIFFWAAKNLPEKHDKCMAFALIFLSKTLPNI